MKQQNLGLNRVLEVPLQREKVKKYFPACDHNPGMRQSIAVFHDSIFTRDYGKRRAPRLYRPAYHIYRYIACSGFMKCMGSDCISLAKQGRLQL